MSLQNMTAAGGVVYTTGGVTPHYKKKGTTHAAIIGEDKIYSCGDGRVVNEQHGVHYIVRGKQQKYRVINESVVCNMAGDEDILEDLVKFVNAYHSRKYTGTNGMHVMKQALNKHPDEWRKTNSRTGRKYQVDVMLLGLDDEGVKTIIHRHADGIEEITGVNSFAVTKCGDMDAQHHHGALQAYNHIQQALSEGNNLNENDYIRVLNQAITISSLYDECTGGVCYGLQLGDIDQNKFGVLEDVETLHILQNLGLHFNEINNGGHLRNCLISVTEGYQYTAINEYTFTSYIVNDFGFARCNVLAVAVKRCLGYEQDDDEEEEEEEDDDVEEGERATIRLHRFATDAQTDLAFQNVSRYGGDEVRKKTYQIVLWSGEVIYFPMKVYRPTKYNVEDIFSEWMPIL